MKKIIICGGTGFIGRNLIEHYANKGFEVTATHFQRPPFEYPGVNWVKIDLRNEEGLADFFKGAEIVIQAAATTSGSKDIVNSPALHVTDNAIMNSLIFRKCHEAQISNVIFFSCSVMYPSQDKKSTENDFDPEKIHDKYFGVGWTKIYLEKMAQFYSTLGKTKFTVLRHSNIYGPWDKFDLEKGHVFGATLTKISNARMKGEKKITLWGTGEEKRDLLHVHDLLAFIDVILEKQSLRFELVNVGSDVGISIKDLAKKLIETTVSELDIEHDLTKPTIPVNIILDSHKARTYGWEPKMTLDEGIRHTWEWYQKIQA